MEIVKFMVNIGIRRFTQTGRVHIKKRVINNSTRTNKSVRIQGKVQVSIRENKGEKLSMSIPTSTLLDSHSKIQRRFPWYYNSNYLQIEE